MKADKPSAGDQDAFGARSADWRHSTARRLTMPLPPVVEAYSRMLRGAFAPLLGRRQNEWRRELTEAIRRLENSTGIPLGSFQERKRFREVLHLATSTAMRTNETEVRAALVNAVLNTAIFRWHGASRPDRFFLWLGQFTSWHIRLLKLFEDPRKWASRNSIEFPRYAVATLSTIVEYAYPQLRGGQSIYDAIWNDLVGQRLVDSAGLHTAMTWRGLMATRTTKLGEEFLRFIEFPG